MNEGRQEEITLLIEQSRDDEDARNRLFELVYEELRELAGRARFVGREGETLQPTALANEAFLQFARRTLLPAASDESGRKLLLLTMRSAMRTILRDYWRKKTAAKRGGDEKTVSLGAHDPADDDVDQFDIAAVDDLMDKLKAHNERWHRIVSLRFFSGLTIPETAEEMGIGQATVKTDWAEAKEWLAERLL